MFDLAYSRQRMVDQQIARRGVQDPRVLKAMREVPREAFVSSEMAEFAYEDAPLPIEAGQTISQPYVVALMLEAAEIRANDRALEIGTGSGYAAAVMGRLAGHVFTIERHRSLAELARARLEAQGYANVEVHVGDGSRGLPAAAPFDVIIAAAGAPSIPDTLRAQLSLGGRLIMPVGDEARHQQLVKLTRRSATEFDEEGLGDVRFVPLIGEYGWDDPVAGRPHQAAAPHEAVSLPAIIAQAAEPLPPLDDPAFGDYFDRFAAARVVLLGECSHGTSEFYRARAAITRRLIDEHGFSIVAVEADWPDAAAIDRNVRWRPQREGASPPFQRFPTWMWRNIEVEDFARWLRRRNAPLEPEHRAGFYGLDLYNLSASIRAVVDYLDRVDPEAAAVARQRYGCLTPWQNEPQTYGRLALTSGYAQCEQPVVRMLSELCERELRYMMTDPDGFLDASQNARLVRDAERYYRIMYYGGAESWSLRNRHMFDTLEQLLAMKGKQSKAVVWAHNSHVGDASKTEMGRVREQLNLGQLCRERFGAGAALIGFGTHVGTIACASDWDGPMEIKQVNPSRPDSYERLAHDAGIPRFLLDLNRSDVVYDALLEERLERFIGVIYRPDTERGSHYSACKLPEQFDAYVWFDETTALTPLPTEQRAGEVETYPFGL